MLWDDDLPRHVVADTNRRTTQVTVIASGTAGFALRTAARLVGVIIPSPTSRSWRHIAPKPAQFELPPARVPTPCA
jgi:hypothetical protein